MVIQTTPSRVVPEHETGDGISTHGFAGHAKSAGACMVSPTQATAVTDTHTKTIWVMKMDGYILAYGAGSAE